MRRGLNDGGEERRWPYVSVSLPAPLVDEVDRLVEGLGYWPSRSSFIREAVMEKVEKHKRELEAKRPREAR